MKKLHLITLIFLFTLCLPLTAHATSPAPASLDTASTWAHSSILSALEKGFVPSDIQNNYTAVITRAEFCRMAVKWVEYAVGKNIDTILTDQNVSRFPNPFSDTDDPDILAAYALGITSGTGGGRFTPNGSFDRQQAATMIQNTCRVIGANVDHSPSSGFMDANMVADWARAGINFVRANGIMQGVGGNMFRPLDMYTREQSIITFNNINLDMSAEGADKVTVIVDGIVVNFAGTPVFLDDNNVLQAPASIIGAALGAAVEWNASRSQITMTRRSRFFEERTNTEVHFHMGNSSYFMRKDGGNFVPHNMNTEPMLVGETPYVPVNHVAEVYNATVKSETRGGELVVTVTSDTKEVRGFTVPQSFTDIVRGADADSSHLQFCSFALNPAQGIVQGKADFIYRQALLLHILAPLLEPSAIPRIDEFINRRGEHTSMDVHNPLIEIFLDSKSNRYVEMGVTQSIVVIVIYDEGAIPEDI